jgi:hypothetical protein
MPKFRRRFDVTGSIFGFREQETKRETEQRTENQFSESAADRFAHQQLKKYYQRNKKRPGLRLMVSIYDSPLHGFKFIEDRFEYLCRNAFPVLPNMGVSGRPKIASRFASPYRIADNRIESQIIGSDFVSSASVSVGSKISTDTKTRGSFEIREVMNMEPEDYGAAMEQVESILGEDVPQMRKEAQTYSKALRLVFARVENLLTKGFSFVQICAACEKSGILPKNANPYCFRQAFRRERARLLAGGELAKLLAEGSETAKKAIAPSPKADMPDGTPAAKATGAQTNLAKRPGKEDAEKEWIREQTSTTVKTGLGKITKNSDGSFDYD